ncbi:MAG: helix-turn-helix domain-containing protein [Candidatus Dormiibacterota bacterium]
MGRGNRGKRAALAPALIEEIERRRQPLARHMARAVAILVRWDQQAGIPPRVDAIVRTCDAGLGLFLATARNGRPGTARELREVAQLGILQARSAQSVEPVLNAYRIATRVAWDAIISAWRGHPDATPDAVMTTANYVFSALDQITFFITRTYLHAREQHFMRGTRARTRLFHSLVSETFDSELEVRKQALALSVALASSYVALIVKVEVPAAEVARSLELPARAIAEATDVQTLAVLWPAERGMPSAETGALLDDLNARGTRARAGTGGLYPGLRGISRSYLEAQQAVEIGRKLRPAATLHHHDELAPYLVLSQNPLVAERYVDHVLGGLLANDPRGALLATLQAVLQSGSLKDAAATLGLHRHTVLYRMEQIRELLGGDLETPAARQRLLLALDLRSLL